MGTSFTQYNKKGFWARDACLEVWLHFLTLEIEQMDRVPKWLESAKEHWHIQATVGFVGCISPDLDRIADNPERRNLIIHISKNALERLYAQGNILEQGYLNSLGIGGEGSYFAKDCQTSVFTVIGQKFVDLLEGNLSTDASNSPVF